jgi:putative FmdB family regulatory protein
MPIYEYQCSACGHQMEAFQKISDAPITECPECHQPTLHKMISASGFQLKGTGWYKTDYSTKGKAPATAKSEDSSNKDSGGESKASDTKSTDKTDKTSGSSSTGNTGTGSS